MSFSPILLMIAKHFQTQLICPQCHRPIRGISVQALDKHWHPGHLKCALCQTPIGLSPFYQYNGQVFHIECHSAHKSTDCIYCGKNSADCHNYWGEKFCCKHSAELPKCRYCSRLILPHWRNSHSPDDMRCAICRKSAVETIEQAQHILPTLVQWLETQGIRFYYLDRRIGLLEPVQLGQFVQTTNRSDLLGALRSFIGYEGKKVKAVEIKGLVVLRGIPKPLFQGVVIHELGHVWLLENRILTLPPWAEEGFCELLSHRFLSQIKTKEGLYYAKMIEDQRDDVYGKGFHRLKRLSEKIGFLPLIAHLREFRELPR